MLGDRWGVTDEELSRRYPCDEVVSAPALQAWRGVTVQAPPERVWPWVVQIRLAPYSYDWLDNRGRRSPRELRGLRDPAVGDPFTAVGGRPAGRILSVVPNTQLTGTIMGAVMSYVLVAVDETSTRLLLKVVMVNGRMVAPLLCLGDLVMARKQLRTLAKLASGNR
jgi:hypothetical protein